jgi:hypothetical protein
MIHTLKFWLLIGSAVAFLLEPRVITAKNRHTDRALQADRLPQITPQLDSPSAVPECLPPIDSFYYDVLDRLAIDLEVTKPASMNKLRQFAADQAAR